MYSYYMSSDVLLFHYVDDNDKNSIIKPENCFLFIQNNIVFFSVFNIYCSTFLNKNNENPRKENYLFENINSERLLKI